MSMDPAYKKSELDAPRDESRSAGPLGWLTNLAARLGLQGPQTLRDTIEVALKNEAQGESAFTAQEREMLLRLLRFGASRVEDIMVPRADIIAVEETEMLRDLVVTFEDAGVSRVPLFRGSLDNPLGMIHIKDLFRWLVAQGAKPALQGKELQANNAASVDDLSGEGGPESGRLSKLNLGSVELARELTTAKLKRPVLYVPPSMPAMNLLIRMQSTRIHMALVVDEYGGTDGLVTIEDLVEQIVGDIEDEHDEAEAAHISTDKMHGLVASARTPIDELEQHLGVKLVTPEEEEDIDTLGGLVFSIVGRVPARGELVRHRTGLEFEVLDADPRRVKKLKIHRGKLKSLPIAEQPSLNRAASS